MELNTDTENNYSLSKNDFFIKKVTGKFIVNSVISTLFVFLGSFIDTLLVGIFLGDKGLSAMSLVSPVYLIFYTVGATIGIGGSILASRVLGGGKIKEYRKIFSCAFYILVLAAVIMTVVGYLLLDPFSRFLSGGSDEHTVRLVKDYLTYYIPAGAFTLVSYIPLYFLKTDGRPQLSLRLFSLSAIINVVLSWLFMSPIFNMGIGGASLATAISMGTVALLGLILLLCRSTELKLVRKCFDLKTVKNIVIAGVPNGLSNLLESAQILMINMLLLGIGEGRLLPCYTVLRNIMGLQNSVIIGMSSALLPLIGVFFGERDFESERLVMKLSKKLGITIMIPLIVVACVLAGVSSRAFGVSDYAVIIESYWAMPLACVGLVAGYINALYTSYLTAVKREWTATLLVALRTFGLLAVFAVPLAFLVGSKGIWFSFSLGEGGTLLAYLLIRYILQHKNTNLDKYLLDTSLEKDGNISFSVKNDVDDVVNASRQCSEYCEEHGVDMKRCMKVCMAIEELISFLSANCFGTDQKKYIDVRVCKIDEEVMLRFRYIGKIFDPINFYEENSDNLDMSEDLLGLKMIFKSATLSDFRQTLGTNNLIIMF